MPFLAEASAQIHEPLNLQHRDAIDSGVDPKLVAASGEGIDVLPAADGPFGAANSPIPVNGRIGALKYLAKLRGQGGWAAMYHLAGSRYSGTAGRLVDRFEVRCLDGSQQCWLNFDVAHPRRSNHAPRGFTLAPFVAALGQDLPVGYGVPHRVPTFPEGLPGAIEAFYPGSLGVAFARRLKLRASFRWPSGVANRSAQQDDRNQASEHDGERAERGLLDHLV